MLVLRCLFGCCYTVCPVCFGIGINLVFSWLLLMQIIVPGRNTLKQLARYTPLHITEWHFRCLLSRGDI